VSDQEIHRYLACDLSTSVKHLLDVFGDERRQYLLEVPMENGPSLGSQFKFTGVAEPVKMLKDGKTEPQKLILKATAGHWPRRGDSAKYLVQGADQKFVFVAKVHVESRPADIGAIENFFDGDRVVISLVNQRMKRFSEPLPRPGDSPVRRPFVFGPGHIPPSTEQTAQNGFVVR
jgi:hypothetical protein